MAIKRATKKTRRSSAEKILAEHIQKVSQKVRPNRAAYARAKKYADNAQLSRRFDYRQKSKIDNLPIRRFRREGECIIGTLGQQTRREWWGESTIPFVLDSGNVILLPGNRRLIKAIQKAKAWCQRVKVTYMGKLRTSYGHYEKVYSVEARPFS